MRGKSIWIVSTVVFSAAVGCQSTPPPPTGFLSTYSNLTPADGSAMRYRSAALANYSAFIVEPVVFQSSGDKDEALKPEQKAEVARYFNESLAAALTKHGYRVVQTPGAGVARVRIALTHIEESKWWMNIHPATKFTGAGKGGAAMEGEVLDSVTGQQLGASIQAGKGPGFRLNPFSTIADVKATIDRWTEAAVKRLDEMGASPK